MRMPSGPRTMTELPTTCITVPSFTSVTVTGFTVVVVVNVAVPCMPGFRSWTDSVLPPTLKRNDSGTVYSFVSPASRTTKRLPSTATTSNVRVSVFVDVDCAEAAPTVSPTTPRQTAISTFGSLGDMDLPFRWSSNGAPAAGRSERGRARAVQRPPGSGPRAPSQRRAIPPSRIPPYLRSPDGCFPRRLGRQNESQGAVPVPMTSARPASTRTGYHEEDEPYHVSVKDALRALECMLPNRRRPRQVATLRRAPAADATR
jgi:hypothetical protein